MNGRARQPFLAAEDMADEEAEETSAARMIANVAEERLLEAEEWS